MDILIGADKAEPALVCCGLDSLLHAVPHVDRIGLFNRLLDSLSRVENKATAIL